MKKLFFLLMIAAVTVYFYPSAPQALLHKLQGSLESLGKSEADERRELAGKRAELAAYEKAVDDITARLDREVANAPVCPTTGQKAIINITQDPRDEVRAKCDILREEIRVLEERVEAGS